MNALYFFIAAGLAGFSFACAGVWMLAGAGWALIAIAASFFCIAAFTRRGLIDG